MVFKHKVKVQNCPKERPELVLIDIYQNVVPLNISSGSSRTLWASFMTVYALKYVMF